MNLRSLYSGVVLSLITTFYANAQELTPPLPPRPLPPAPASTESASAPSQQAVPAPGRLTPAAKPNPQQSEVIPLRFTTGQTALRSAPKTGYYIAAFGGANFFQETSDRTTVENPPGFPDGTLDMRSRVGGIGGVKFGYDWPFNDAPIEQWAKEVGGEGFRMSGALEFEAFYAYIPFRGEDPNGVSVGADFHTMNFMGNALLKFQAGNWRPYVGPGVGVVQMFGKNYDVGGSRQRDDTATSVAFQALAGTDYFISNDWSVFAEYRWMLINDPQIFHSPRTLKFDGLQSHYFEVGIKKHF